MFTNKQLERYADVLWWGLSTARTSPFKKEDIVLIRYHRPAIKLAEILYGRLLAQGYHPVQRMSPTTMMERQFYLLSTNSQLVFLPPGDKELMSRLNGSIFLYAPESITHLQDIDPEKIGKTAVAQKHLRDILNRRESRGTFSWTLCVFPTAELAGQAGLSLESYTRQIIKACFLNKTAPVAQWQHVYKNAQSIKKWLNSLKVAYFHVESKNIDLEVSPGRNRQWVGISGRNIPSFEIFLSPDWRGVRGKYYADQPSYRSGNRVEGVRLEFKKGRAIKIAADMGTDFVIMYDENYGGKNGNCHIALGSSYSNTYAGDSKKLTAARKRGLGFNESALHWDLVNTEKKRVSAHLKSGKTIGIYENGRFLK